MVDLQGVKKTMIDISRVCTAKQFADLCANDASYHNKEYVFLSEKQVRGELCGGVIKGNLPEKSIAIIPNECTAYYIAFLLTSMPCQYALFGQKFNILDKVRISKKAVDRLTVFQVSKESEKAYSVAQELKQNMHYIYNKERDNLQYQHWMMIVTDLCNVLALELYAHPMFEKLGIFILENWKKVVDEYEKSKIVDILLDSLIKNDSSLRNQIMRVHMIEDIFDRYIKEIGNGLENK